MAHDSLLQVQLAEPEVARGHPLKDDKQHDKLLEYCRERLNFGAQFRDNVIGRFEEIDRSLAGFLQLSKEDLERERDNLAGKSPKPTAMNVQFAFTQINRGVTFLLSVFSPEGGMFEALASGDNQRIANAITKRLNDDSIHSGYFRQLAIFFLCALKYNYGGLRIWWDEEYGPTLAAQPGGGREIDTNPNAPRWAGNRVKAIDVYNTLFDPSVSPIDVHRDGEFVGEASMHTIFRIKMMAEARQLYNINRFLNGGQFRTQTRGAGNVTYFKQPPAVRLSQHGNQLGSGSTNWFNILSPYSQGQESVESGVELVSLYIRLLPKEFGLVGAREDRNLLEIWKITIANGQHIVNTQHMPNIHNWLPYVFSIPAEDNLALESKSIGEQLLPLQNFANFLLNTHMAATRKNIWDLIVYDPNIVDLASIGEDVAARVPMKNSAAGKDIQKAMWKPDLRVDTSRTFDEVESVIELMEFIFPTRTVQQVASLERATTMQAAAVIQGSHRDLWRYAKITDDQAGQPARQIMYSNILQFADDIEVLGPDGQMIAINAGQVIEAKIEFSIGEGLKSIDRLTVVQNLKEMINAIIQNKDALSEYDVPALINFWSSLFGVTQDLTRFTRAATGRGVPPTVQAEQQQAAAAQAEAAAAAGGPP